jgi:glutamyl-tRNA synthetase
MIQVGPKPINSMLSWDHIASVNRRIIEPKAKRFFFVKDPVAIRVSGTEEVYVARLMRHPDHPDWGTRDYEVRLEEGSVSFVISRDDLSKLNHGGIDRLMGLFNIEVMEKSLDGVEARYHSKGYQEAREADAPFIHWLQSGVGIQAKVVMPDASSAEGLAEPGCEDLRADDMIQFERFGFVRVESVSPFVAFYSHR